MTYSEFCKQELCYETKTTFWEDFAIADRFGMEAIKDTFKRAFDEWKTDIKYLTELALVLNHRACKHYAEDRMRYSALYTELYDKVDAWAYENLSKEDLDYYFNVID